MQERAGLTGSLRYPAILTGSYVVIGAAYIYLSGKIALGNTLSAESLARLELLKGMGFIALTGALLFGLSLHFVRRLRADALALLRHRESLVQSERQAMAGLMASTIAHDSRNLMAAMGANLTLLSERVEEDDEAQELLDELRDSLRHMALSAAQLQGGTSEHQQAEWLELRSWIEKEVSLLQRHERIIGCSVQVEAQGERYDLFGYPHLLHQLLLNLLLNAADAAGQGGSIRVRLCGGEEGPVTIEVHDDGPGIPADERSEILATGYTTKSHGTGLGLLSVQTVVEAHEAELDIGDSPMGGARFRVAFPASRWEGSAGDSPPTALGL